MAEQKTITSMMEETRTFPPSADFVAQAYIKSRAEYEKLYKRSMDDPAGFWGDIASELHWFKKWDKVNEEDFANAQIKWFINGKTNIRLQLP